MKWSSGGRRGKGAVVMSRGIGSVSHESYYFGVKVSAKYRRQGTSEQGQWSRQGSAARKQPLSCNCWQLGNFRSYSPPRRYTIGLQRGCRVRMAGDVIMAAWKRPRLSVVCYKREVDVVISRDLPPAGDNSSAAIVVEMLAVTRFALFGQLEKRKEKREAAPQ